LCSGLFQGHKRGWELALKSPSVTPAEVLPFVKFCVLQMMVLDIKASYYFIYFIESCITDHSIFFKLSRSDLKDLFPDKADFLLRKKLWDIIIQYVSKNTAKCTAN